MEAHTIQNLLEKVAVINKKYGELAKLTGENFNIFRILKVEKKEVRMHSALLASLLNVEGSHGFRDTFLKIFIEQQKDKQKENIEFVKRFDGFNTQKSSVSVELNIGFKNKDETEGGRIDILIKNQPKLAIIIENKIDGGDEYNQLVRYNNAFRESPIFYLTLDGKDPSSDSKGKLQKGGEYVCISYKDDILNWLEKCREKAVNHPILRETIAQYIFLIKHLTRQTMNEQSKTEIITTVLQSPENIESAENIFNCWKEVRLKIMDNLKIKIMNDNYIRNSLKLLVEFNEDHKLGEKKSGFWFFKDGWKNTIYFFFNNDFDSLLFGIFPDESNGQNDSQLKDDLDKKLSNIGKNLKWSDWMWVSHFEIWENTPWKNVENDGFNGVKEILKTTLEKLEGLNL